MKEQKSRMLQGIYTSSMGISMAVLILMAVLEVFMLVYTVVNSTLYGGYIWKYRAFYTALLAVVLIAILLNVLAGRDMEHRYRWLNIANPICACFFFAWAIGITWSDMQVSGSIDPTVFMTFSLTIPLSFYLFPGVYAGIAGTADILMVLIAVGNYIGVVINLVIFFVFQLVLGIIFLMLRARLTERILKEKENACRDAMTGFLNRRAYEEDIRRLENSDRTEGLAYLSIDLNDLKETNDRYGHAEGDKLLVGAAECIKEIFGEAEKMYRVGGDEFVVLLCADRDKMELLLNEFENSMHAWTDRNALYLSAACGYVFFDDMPYGDPDWPAREADRRMYEAKARYHAQK